MVTLIDYALMAGGSYISSRADLNRFATPKDWTELIEFRKSDSASGFEATAFSNGIETVISYAGTDFSQPGNDFLHGNIPLATGFVSDQLRQAAEYYLQLKAIKPNITITGHSLGGGLASLIGVFFGATTFTFDQAPFAQTARFGATALKSYLVDQGHTALELSGLTNFITLQQADGGIPNSGLVTNLNVQGEIVSLGSSLRIGNDASIQKGTNASVLDIPFAVSLHSQALLTAFLQANQTAATGKGLADVTFKLTDLLKMVFDDKLFAFKTDKSNTKDENFLERIVKHETGVGVVIPKDAMVTRFTADLWKLAKDNGLTLTDGNAGFFSSATNNISKALSAFAMQKYYEETTASAGYKKELFEQITGGIQFDMANVSKKFAAAFQASEKLTLKDAKGFDLYFKNYLASTNFTGSERQLIEAVLPFMRHWYVQAGSNGLAYTDSQNRGAFMLGGNGSDALVGGVHKNHYQLKSYLRPYLLGSSPIRYPKTAQKVPLDASASYQSTRSSIRHTTNSIAACARKQGVRGRFSSQNGLKTNQNCFVVNF